MASKPQTLLIFSQVFLPDPASLGQYLADVAIEMARRGYRVRVFTANRGYDDAALKYLPHETIRDVEITRLPFSSFGKGNLLSRVIGTLSFMVQAFFIALFLPRVNGIFFSTSPPLIGFVLCLAAMLRRIPVAYWLMDLNPDQLIAVGKLKADGFAVKALNVIHGFILHRSKLVIALDRFMAQRLENRVSPRNVLVMPPWPQENRLEPVDRESNPFQIRHGLTGKFVFMYSGNHSTSNPLTTLLNSAIELKNDSTIHFLFVGGGTGKKEITTAIQEHNLTHVLSLPYQPIEELRYSLSAADVHVVSLGSNMVGIIHPCKIYGAMAVSRPILYLGPEPSHITELLVNHNFGWHVEHGDTAKMTETIQQIKNTPRQKLDAMGDEGNTVLSQSLNQATLCTRFCNQLETSLGFVVKDADIKPERSMADTI